MLGLKKNSKVSDKSSDFVKNKIFLFVALDQL